MFVPAVGLIVANRYALTQVLGRGGMGEVWRAHDQDLDSPCAIKFILPHLASDRGTRDRFVREARAVARLSSPHVVHVLGVGEEDGMLYLALQLLEGETLRSRLLRIGKLHPTLTLELAEQVGDALENARDAGIVHRDLKPENIWCWSGNKMFAKVLDFGVAKSTLTAPSFKTATGALLGTPQYMSPEQVLGSRDIDHCSDLWALALIIVECLTGKRAFDGPSIGNLLIEIASGRVPPLRELGPELPEGLEPWWVRALARDPRDRYPSATELVGELRPYLARPSPEWLAAQSASVSATHGAMLACAVSSSRPVPVTRSVQVGEPLPPPHVTGTYAQDELGLRFRRSIGLATPSQARPVIVASSRRRLSNASVGAEKRSHPESPPRRVIGRRILAAAGLVTLAIVVLLAGVRRFIGPRETGANAGVAGAARTPHVSVDPAGAHTPSPALPTLVSQGTRTASPAEAGEASGADSSGPGAAPPVQPNTERAQHAAAKDPQPKPRSGVPRQTTAAPAPPAPRVGIIDDDALATNEPDDPPVKANGGEARSEGAPIRTVDDALGLRDDRHDARGTRADDLARKARLKELERQLGLLPVRE